MVERTPDCGLHSVTVVSKRRSVIEWISDGCQLIVRRFVSHRSADRLRRSHVYVLAPSLVRFPFRS